MFNIVIAIHVIACALLILIVLIQQGRGGGLIDSLSSAENILGTKTNTFLVKATSVLAVVFFFTCLSLAFLSIRKGKSLIETKYRPTATAPAQRAVAAEKTADAGKTSATQAAEKTQAPPIAQTTTSPQSAQGAPTPMANVETKK